MQVMSPSSPRPQCSTCTLNHEHAHVHSPSHISFEVSRVPPNFLIPGPRSSAMLTGATNVSPMPNPHLGVVDLTESPIPSPCSSNPSLSLSPTSFSSSMSLTVPPPKGSQSKPRDHPPPVLLSPQSSVFPSPQVTLTPTRTPRRRSKFILPNDVDDRDQADAYDDSDDSDRTSFFSAEEILVPGGAIPSAAGKVLYPQVIRRSDGHSHVWDSLELGPGPLLDVLERHAATLVNEKRDAAHSLKRWYALMEIVHTEAGYVRDLRALVKVYLVLLPSLPLSASAHQAVQELSREASELLVLHEGFLSALRNASSLATDGGTPIWNIDEAVGRVAGLFIKEASSFDLYQRFCAAQPDTLRLLRPVQARAEWAVFEQRCAGGGDEVAETNPLVQSNEGKILESNLNVNGGSGASPNSTSASTTTTAVPFRPPTRRTVPPRTLSLMPSAFKAYTSSSPTSQATDLPPSIRRHSHDSLAAVFGASSPGSVKHRSGSVTSSSESSSSSSSSTCPSTPNSRLRFHDFLIKPVQRICKYPLMLEGLRSKTHGENADATVASAVESMRAVAMRVDEARRQREAAVRSKLIVDRIEPHAVVTTEFIRSLGECVLAGSLDVVHHHHILNPVTTPVRVRYLGAFLYLGGYILLVKVDKGKVYRIKHWFSLAPFDLVDIPQDTALVPCSFRLSYMDHHFEIAAACQPEKDLWMKAINEARRTHPAWNCEPVSSLQIVQVDLSTPPVDGNVLDVAETPAVSTGVSSSSSISDLSNPLAVLRLSNTRSRISPSNPTVRIFSLTDGSSILLRRSSGTNRIFVDRGLVDVLSELVSSLRKQAQAREESLFPPPHSSDTSQPISIAAKNRLTKRGSMLVARPRTLFLPSGVDSEDDTTEQPSSTIRRGSTYTSRSHHSLLPASSVLYDGTERWNNSSTGSSSRPELPARPRISFDKSRLTSGALSLPSSPTISSVHQPPQLSDTDDTPRNHRRARSLVGSVRDLVRRATTKLTYAQQASETWQTLQTPDDTSSDAGDSMETASSTTRRRVSSAPTSPPVTSTCVLFSKSCSQPQPIIVDSPILQEGIQPTPTTSGLKPLNKKPGLIPSNPHQSLNPRRSFKNFIFYNRMTAIDPA